MSETHALPEYHDESGLYEIRIKGHLDDRWSDWFGGLTITLEEDGHAFNRPVDRSGCLAWLAQKSA